ncbi:MAG: hypothetical protein JO097_15905 [Acidobacteriaceae bacterium]|nr:hypothetical protein [Acidobacteriaceae bacterium]MBV9767132.1 hypothetical protein [Acidobacteriaceae bacterium]
MTTRRQTTPHNDAKWSNPKVLAILAVVFLCGAAFGSAVTRGYLHARMSAAPHDQLAIEAARKVGLERLKAQLNLTPQQEETVTKVLDDYGKYYQNIEDDREDVAAHGKQRILDVLNDEQKKRFNEIFGTVSR